MKAIKIFIVLAIVIFAGCAKKSDSKSETNKSSSPSSAQAKFLPRINL